jgi:hypothetical protein
MFRVAIIYTLGFFGFLQVFHPSLHNCLHHIQFPQQRSPTIPPLTHTRTDIHHLLTVSPILRWYIYHSFDSISRQMIRMQAVMARRSYGRSKTVSNPLPTSHFSTFLFCAAVLFSLRTGELKSCVCFCDLRRRGWICAYYYLSPIHSQFSSNHSIATKDLQQ